MKNAMQRVTLVLLLIVALSGCALQKPAPRVVVYDFGPGPLISAAPTAGKAVPALLLEMLEAPAALDSTAVLYRLAYADSQQLRPYALARWSMTPAQLLRQHFRQQLGGQRALLNPGDSAAPNATKPLLLQLELEEFSQLFESADMSTGLLRLRATLTRPGAQGGQWLEQRSLTVQRKASTADAAGGVQALAAATEAAAQELDQWLREFER
jgi:cholesterol transport system auxiliary component